MKKLIHVLLGFVVPLTITGCMSKIYEAEGQNMDSTGKVVTSQFRVRYSEPELMDKAIHAVSNVGTIKVSQDAQASGGGVNPFTYHVDLGWFASALDIFPLKPGTKFKRTIMDKSNLPYSTSVGFYSTVTLEYNPPAGSTNLPAGNAEIITEPQYLINTPFLKVANPMFPLKTTANINTFGAPAKMPDMSTVNADILINGKKP